MQCPGCGLAHAHSHADLHAEMGIGQLGNLGPTSAAWLQHAGLHTAADLSSVGAVDAFLRVKALGFKPSLNLLYALEGAIAGEHWLQVKRQRKTELVLALVAAEERGEL